MPSLGKIEEFNAVSTNINYLELLEQYFAVNGVPSDSSDLHKRRATLISVIGSRPYDFLADLCCPVSPSAKTYVQLANIRKNHFAPKILVIAERYRFDKCSMREGESVATFAADLKHLTSSCDFTTLLIEALRDLFVCGLCNKDIQEKLLTEEHRLHLGRKRPRKTSLLTLKTPQLWQTSWIRGTGGLFFHTNLTNLLARAKERNLLPGTIIPVLQNASAAGDPAIHAYSVDTGVTLAILAAWEYGAYHRCLQKQTSEDS